MLSRGSPDKTTQTVPNSKIMQERLASDLSDSSTESGMMGLKKPVASSATAGTSTAPLGNVSAGTPHTATTNATGGKDMALQQEAALAVPEGYDSNRRGSAGMIKVKLASASPQWDNKAEVEVDCENPDEVVNKMLQSIVDKFPPTSVITVEKGGVPIGAVTSGGPAPMQRPGSMAGSPQNQGPFVSQQSYNQQPYGHYPSQQSFHQPMGPQFAQYAPGPDQNRQYPAQYPVQYPAQYPGQPQQHPTPLHHQHSSFYQQSSKQFTQELGKHGSQPSASNASHPHQHPRQPHSTASSVASHPHQQGQQRGISDHTLLQEVPKFVPKVEVREIVKEVPKYEVEYIDKVVEVAQIKYVDKLEEVQQVQEVIKHVPKYETIDVPREVVKYVPKIVTKIVENVVEVPRGEKIPIMRPQTVDTPFVVPRFQDRNVPVEMSRLIIPEIEETDEIVEVEVSKYVPYLVPVDVYVPLPVTVPVKVKDDGEESEHQCTNVDPNLLQHLMIEMNPHLQQLELFNLNQQELFQQNIQQSIQQAQEHGLAPPVPIMNGPTIHQGASGSANVTSSFPIREKSGASRSSSAGASRRRASRQVSRRVTATPGGGTSSRKASQPPPTMMINGPPPQYNGYPPMHNSGGAPPAMMYQPQMTR